MIASDLQMKSICEGTLILTFSQGEKELPGGISKFARQLPLPLGEGWGEGILAAYISQ